MKKKYKKVWRNPVNLWATRLLALLIVLPFLMSIILRELLRLECTFLTTADRRHLWGCLFTALNNSDYWALTCAYKPPNLSAFSVFFLSPFSFASTLGFYFSYIMVVRALIYLLTQQWVRTFVPVMMGEKGEKEMDGKNSVSFWIIFS
jgi:hypothetical protein